MIWLDHIRVTGSWSVQGVHIYVWHINNDVPGDVIVLLVVVLENGLDKVRHRVHEEVGTEIADLDAAITRARIVPARVGLVLCFESIAPLAMCFVYFIDTEIF